MIVDIVSVATEALEGAYGRKVKRWEKKTGKRREGGRGGERKGENEGGFKVKGREIRRE